MRDLARFLAACSVLAFSTGAAVAQDDNRALVRQRFVAEVERQAAEFDGVMGIAIKDLTSNEEIRVHDELVFPTGSAIKVPILITLEKQAAEGRYKLTDPRKLFNKDEVESSSLQYFGDGTSSLSLHDLAVLMIRNSDNTATNMLIDQVGLANVNRTLDELGLTQIRLRRKMIDMAASGRGDENTATPREVVRMLEMLHRNQLVSPALCRNVLTMMKYPKGWGTFANVLPPGVEVANKAGSIGAVYTDWAIVYARNRPFAIAVMTNYNASEHGPEARDAVAKVGKLAYDYFARLGQSTAYGARVPFEHLPQQSR